MPLPALLGPIIGGLASVGGALLGNRANRDQSREQMRFQERMSSTAAQRSVADFRAAGLNPGLAYGTTASSPMGARAEQEDVVGRGLSTALNVRQAQAQIAATEAQASKANMEAQQIGIENVIQTQTETSAPSQVPLFLMRRNQLMRDLQQRAGVQPHELRSVKAAADLQELNAAVRRLDLPKAQAEAYMYKRFGAAIPAAGMIGSTAKAAASVTAAGRAAKVGRAVLQRVGKFRTR